MPTETNNKKIAKNTMFLYFRMMVTMVISLYTSRVVLQVLGFDDYGIYQAIDGININSRLRYDPDNCDFSIL